MGYFLFEFFYGCIVRGLFVIVKESWIEKKLIEGNIVSYVFEI